MRRILILVGIATAVVMTAVAVFLLSTLPPRALQPVTQGERRSVALGAYHVHSSRSDGSGTVEEIAASAKSAGLDFVVLTDHGDATAPIEAPRYVDGVLLIDGVEINTDAGHVVAMDLRRASVYPLAGDARDVVEDIHRLGGWAIAAHADSPQPGLRWRGSQMPVDGVEWLNVDSEWRSHTFSNVAATALRSTIRGPESVASLFRAPAPGLSRWDLLQRGGGSVGLAAVDAHARLGADDEEWGSLARLRFPSYTGLFRSVAQVVVLPSPLTGHADTDGKVLQQSLRAGRSYTIIRAFADVVPAIDFEASTHVGRLQMGAHVPPEFGGTLTADVQAAIPARVDLLRDGRILQSSQDRVQFQIPPASGAYRVEAYLPGHRMPWLVTNPIYFDRPVVTPPAKPIAAPPQGLRVPVASWRIEAASTSRGAIERDGDDALQWSYQLGAGTPAGQFVALATDASGTAALDRIAITATSQTPMRLSLQVRVPGGRDGRRWRKSLYFDTDPRTYVVALSELDPVERGSPLRPVVARVQSVLLVIDTVNAAPGTSGRVRVHDVKLITAPEAPRSAR